MSAVTIEELQVIIEAQTSGFKKEIAGVKSQMQGMTNSVNDQTSKVKSAFSGIGKVVATAFAATAVVKFGASCIKLGSDLTEVQNVVDTAFGSMSYKMENFADTSIQTFGLSELTAKQMGSTYMAMAKGMGQASDIASSMATTLTGRLGDVMSFYNKSALEADTIGKAIYTGETEPLKAIGVVMTQNSLKAFAMANGFSKAYDEMSSGEQLLVRQQYFLEKTSLAAGDFAKTSGSWANQTRILSEQFNVLKTSIGQGLINAFTPAIHVINTLLARAQVMASYFKSFTTSLFGNANSSSSAVSDAESIANSMQDTATAASATNNSLLGFDQITKLGDSTSDTGSTNSATNTDGSSGLLDNMASSTDKSATKIAEAIQRIRDVTEPTRVALKNLWDDGLSKFGNFIATGCMDFYEEFLKPLGKWTLGKGLPELADTTNDFLTDINWDKLNSNLKKFEKAIEPFAEGVGQGMLNFFKTLVSIGSATINIISGAIGFFGDSLDALPASSLEFLGERLGEIIGAFLLFKTAMGVASTITAISTSFGGFMAVISAHPYIVLAAGIIALMSALQSLTREKDSIDILSDINDTFNSTITSGQAESKVMNDLATEYYNLAGKAELSNDERARAKVIAKELIDAYPDLKQYYNDSSGLLVTEKDNITKVIDEKLKEIKIKAYEGKLIELEQKKIDIADQLADAQKKQAELAKKSAYYIQQSSAPVKDLGYLTDMLTGQVAKNTFAFNDANKEVVSYQQQLRDIDGELTTTKATFGDLSSGVDNSATTITNAGNTTVQATSNMTTSASNMASGVSSSMNGASASFGDMASKASGSSIIVRDAFAEVASSLAIAGFNAKTSFLNNLDPNGIGAKAYDVVGGIKSAFNNLDLSSYGVKAGDTFIESLGQKLAGTEFQMGMNPNMNTGNVALTISRIKKYANGGFPGVGEIFMGNENGIEMMGKHGNRNVVANNDQITTGIASAVREAIVPLFMAMGSKGKNQAPVVEFTWVTDNETMYQKFSTGKQTADNRYKVVGTI